MGSMKDALLKAGLKPSTTAKDQNTRENINKKKAPESVAHQYQRNFCEECQTTQPDVEQYRHNLPTTEAEWICLRCADRLRIHDKFRRSTQSDTSIKRLFKREHGPTMTDAEIKAAQGKSKPDFAKGNK
jgi:hypothetical protein